MATKAEKALDARLTRIYGQRFSGVQVPMMKLPSIYQAGKAVALHAGSTDEQVGDAMAAIVAVVRAN